MRNIGFLFNQHIFPARPTKHHSPKPTHPSPQQPSNYLITQPPLPSARQPQTISLLTSFTLSHQQLRKLQINLELNKFYTNKQKFIHTNITNQYDDKNLVIPDGMFHKTEDITPELKPKPKHLNRLLAASTSLNNPEQVLATTETAGGYQVDMNKSLEYKFKRSPSIVFRKQGHFHQTGKIRKLSPEVKVAENKGKKFVEVERRVYKENIRQEEVQKKDLAVKVVGGFEEGHARFKTLMESAAKMVGKYKI